MLVPLWTMVTADGPVIAPTRTLTTPAPVVEKAASARLALPSSALTSRIAPERRKSLSLTWA
jgi:hypothetical protein